MSNLSFAQTPEIQEYLKTLEIGDSFNYRNLTIIPIYAKTFRDKTDYLTLDEAMSKGYLTITELEGGRVPQVKLKNDSDHYILVVAGEMLKGCKQDRLVGRDGLISPKKEVILPVYCSERGRWSSVSNKFESGMSQAEPHLRGMLYSRKNQDTIWGGIRNSASGLGVNSSTEALQEIYRDEKVSRKISNYTERLENIPRLEEDAVGVVVGLGDKVVGIDIFANPSLFAKLWSKLLRSYAVSAISEENLKGVITKEQAKKILNEIYRVEFSRQSGLDLGEDLQANVAGMICSALVYRGNVIHFAAFCGEKESIQKRDIRIPIIE